MNLKKLVIATNLMLYTASSQADVALEDFNKESYAFRGALALAGLAPPPMNVLGAAIAGGVLTPAGSGAEIDEMNERLIDIQSDLSEIKNMIRNLRGDVLSDFQNYMAGRDYITIQSRLNYVINTLDDDYKSFTDGRSSESREKLLTPLHDLLSETITWFITDSSLSNTERLSTAGDFMALMTVHMSVLQELVEIYRQQAYVDCAGSLCDERVEILKTNVNIFSAKVDRYIDYLVSIATDSRTYRNDQFGNLKINATPKELCSGWPIRCNIYAIDFYYSGYDAETKKYYVGGKHTQSPSSFDQELSTEMELRAESGWAAYKKKIMDEFDAKLDAEIYSIRDNLEIAKENYEFLDNDIYKQDCVRFYENVDFTGQYHTMCGVDSQKTLTARTRCSRTTDPIVRGCTTVHQSWGNALGSNISSISLGNGKAINLYSGSSYSGNMITIEGEKSVNLQDFGFDNLTRSVELLNSQ